MIDIEHASISIYTSEWIYISSSSWNGWKFGRIGMMSWVTTTYFRCLGRHHQLATQVTRECYSQLLMTIKDVSCCCCWRRLIHHVSVIAVTMIVVIVVVSNDIPVGFSMPVLQLLLLHTNLLYSDWKKGKRMKKSSRRRRPALPTSVTPPLASRPWRRKAAEECCRRTGLWWISSRISLFYVYVRLSIYLTISISSLLLFRACVGFFIFFLLLLLDSTVRGSCVGRCREPFIRQVSVVGVERAFTSLDTQSIIDWSHSVSHSSIRRSSASSDT